MLTKSEILAVEEEDEVDEWDRSRMSGNISMELGNTSKTDMEDILNADTSNWDPFRDAHKFEALAAQEQKARQESVQAQFNLIRKQEDEERAQFEVVERTEDLEASIHIAETKLE